MTIQNTLGLVASIGGLGGITYLYRNELGYFYNVMSAFLAVFGAISLEKLRREWILRFVKRFCLTLVDRLVLRCIRTVDSDLIGDHPFLGLALSVPDSS